MALTSSSTDDGFREIQLNGKQLVFLFMAVTVVLVVTFLTGVLVGRGVRAERASEQVTALSEDSPAAPPRSTPAIAQPENDPTKVAPPSSPEDGVDAGKKAADTPPDEAPVAVNRSNPPQPPAVAAAPADPPKVAAPAKSAPAQAPAAKPAAVASAAAPPRPTPPPAAANTPVPASPPAPTNTSVPPTPTATTGAVRDGYAVQVAAVNAKSEADSIKNRLSAKGYQAYVEEPKGSQKMFRVRVGTFKSRSEAVTVADKLKKEEKFKPWVTR